PAVRGGLGGALGGALKVAGGAAGDWAGEPQAGGASSALYHAASAVLPAWEGTRDRADARRALLSRFVLEHRLAPKDPLAPEERAWGGPALAPLLGKASVPAPRTASLLAA